MRAAELLADMLLYEANQAFGIVFGPGIPDHGYWVAGNDLGELLSKARTGVEPASGKTLSQQWDENLTHLLQKGYSMVVPDMDGTQNGDVIVYGHEIPELTPKAVQIMKLKAATPVMHIFGIEQGREKRMTAKDAFGLEMTPKEKEEFKQQRAERAQKSNLPPEDQEEFAQMQAAKGHFGLAQQPKGTRPYAGSVTPAPPGGAAPAAAPATTPATTTATPTDWRKFPGADREAKRAAARAAGMLGRKP